MKEMKQRYGVFSLPRVPTGSTLAPAPRRFPHEDSGHGFGGPEVLSGASLAPSQVILGNTREAILTESEAREIDQDESNLVAPDIPISLSPMAASFQRKYSDEIVSSSINGDLQSLEQIGALAHSGGGKKIKVAILDSGIDENHSAFRGKVRLKQRDFTVANPEATNKAPDYSGHGTHCAGTIFGRAVNGTRIGIADGVEEAIIAKVVGGGSYSGSIRLFQALQWALAEGANVISMSLSFDFASYARDLREHRNVPEAIATSRALRAFIENVSLFNSIESILMSYSRVRPIMIFAATGNQSLRGKGPEGFDAAHLTSPAAARGISAVGAIDVEGNVAEFSNSGPDMVAPGVSITSADLGHGLIRKSGTSMATPHAAGAAVLWMEREGASANARRIFERMKSSYAAGERPVIDYGLGKVRCPD